MPTHDQPDPLRIVVLQGSVRSERVGPAVADWAIEPLEVSEEFAVDVIDLAKVTLPDPTDLRPGGKGEPSEISPRLEAADAFMIITPEYNRGCPSTVKHAIDCHFLEWMFKPVLPVTYGVYGGLLAAEQLRSVFAELHAVTTRKAVGVAEPWSLLDQHGRLQPGPTAVRALRLGIRELSWWASALRHQRRTSPFVWQP
ncbi:NADPH-dependent FMN reductase [Microlunatus speluncae]|uniref:NADPH-dependent FMN reductase n=1 Tax=Microlunatus speluncae TaxID=2594267 RepID=UPI0012662660|nr:NAD(P)H-dependent oxidoreductase [Microlunatus speluncae]